MEHIRVLNFQIKTPTKVVKFVPGDDNINFKLSFGTALISDGDIAVAIINLTCEVKKTEEEICWMEAHYFFPIKNTTGVELRTLLNAEPGLQAQIIALAYSTLRGMLFERTRGTILQTELLPTVQPKDLIQSVRHEGHTYAEFPNPEVGPK